jgi:hypothetical protein
MTMIEELERLFEFVKSKDKEVSELYLKLVLDKYKISIIEKYVFSFEPNIIITNHLIPGVKSITIRVIYTPVFHYYEYDTITEEFLNPYLNSLKK